MLPGPMARAATVYDILIASPGDVARERELVRNVIHNWNVLHGRRRGCVLEPVMWETHSAPEFGDRPQAIINRQIVDTCDALIGVFWTRLGTPTGAGPSGTVEEIERFAGSKKPVMLYFGSRSVDLNQVDAEQLTGLRRFRDDCKSRGLLEEYRDLDELRQKVARALEHLVDSLLAATDLAVDPAVPGERARQTVVELRRMLKRLELSRGLRHLGHNDGKDVMMEFTDWFVSNQDELNGPESAWDALANYSAQMTKYQFTASRGSSERFFEIGVSILQNAISLLESGEPSPKVRGVDQKILECFYKTKSRNDRKSVDQVSEELGVSPDEVRQSIDVLEPLGLVRRQSYFNARDDYEVTGSDKSQGSCRVS